MTLLRAGLRQAIFLIPLAFLVFFFLYPLGAILRLSFTTPAFSGGPGLFSDPYYIEVIGFSFWQATLSTLLTLLVGLPAAFVFARYQFRGKALLRALATVPFVLPTVVVAAGFTALVGPRGLMSAVFQLFGAPPLQVINTLGLVLVAHVFYNYGVVLRLVGGFWATLDPRLEQAAAVLGASRMRIFRTITLPLLLPSIGAAALLVFIFTFSSFGVVLLLGGPRLATVEVEIYRQTTQSLRLDAAAALSLIQMAVTLLLTVLYTRLLAQNKGRLDLRVRAGVTRPPRTIGERLLLGGVIVVLIICVLPLIALAVRSVTLPARPTDPWAWTIEYYQLLDQNRRGSLFFVPPLAALRNSLGFALTTMVLAMLVGVPAAYLLARTANQNLTEARFSKVGTWFARLLDPLFMLPLGTSAVMLGLGYIVALGPLRLLDSPWLIPIAHTLLAFPFVVRTLLPALRGINPRLREAARVLGAGPVRVLRTVDLPLLAPALLAGALFAFIVSLGDFGATLLLARPEYPTVPLVIGRFLGQPGAANYGQALALSTILMLASIASFLILERIRPAESGEL